MLHVQGNIVSKKTQEIKFIDKKTGEKKVFDQHTAYIVNGGDPVRIQSYDPIVEDIGDEVDYPVFVKTYNGKNGSGYNLILQNE